MRKMGFEGTVQLIAQQFIQFLKVDEFLKVDRCSMRWPDGKKIAAYGTEAENMKEKIIMDETTVAGQALITKDIVITDITKDPRYDPGYIKNAELKYLLALPLIIKTDTGEDEVFGVVQVYSKNPFSDTQISTAKMLAQTAAPTLYLIESSKESRKAMRKLPKVILHCRSLEEIFLHSVDEIAVRLGVKSCLIYHVFPKDGEQWCKITAGVPKGEHQIGLLDPLSKHPDIELAVTEKKLAVRDLMTDEKTAHLHDWAERKGIRRGMYCPLIMNVDDKDKVKVIGVLVAEIRKDDDKDNFSAEERSFFYDYSISIADLICHDEITFQEVRDKIVNPSSSAGGFAKLLFKEMAWLQENIENFCKNNQGTCPGAKKMCKSADQLRSYAKTIYTNVETIQESLSEVKQTHS